MINWLNLTSIIVENIRNDILSNLVTRIPLILVFDPDSFEPPFTNGLDEFLAINNLTTIYGDVSEDANSLARYKLISSQLFLVYFTDFLSLLFTGLDVIYSIIRICLSTIFFGVLLSILGFFVIWTIVTLTRRWKLIVLFIRNNEFGGVW